MISMPSRRVSTVVLLFLFFFSIYTFAMSGWIQYGDEMEKYRVAQSMVERGDFSFRPTAQRNVIGAGGRTVSGYELGQILLEVPFYALGKLAYTFFPVPDSNWLTMLAVGLMNPFVTALAMVVFFKIAETLGLSFRIALGLTCALGLATIVFPYSRSFTREPLLTLLLLLSLFTALRFGKTRANRWLLLMGLATGYLTFTKFIHGVVIPIFMLYLIAVIWQSEHRRGARRAQVALAMLKGVSVYLLPGMILLAIQSIYSLMRFGTFTSGLAGVPDDPLTWIAYLLPFGKPLEAIVGLLLLPEKSVFLYSPPIVLGLIGWWRWFQAQRRDALLIFFLILVEFVPVILRYDWDGGTWWGPRYLVQLTPLLMLSVGFLFDPNNHRAHRRWAITFAILCVLGLLIQSVGALVSDRDYLDVTGKGSTLAGQIDFLLRGAIDSLMIALSPDGFPVRVNPFGVWLIAMVIVIGWRIAAQWRNERADAASWKISGLVLGGILFVEGFGFLAGIVAPYPQIIAAKGDTQYVAANNFLAEGKSCQALAFYGKSLERDTNLSRQAARQIEKLWAPALGKSITLGNPALWIEEESPASFEQDSETTITGKGSFRFSAPPLQNVSIVITSEPLPAAPDAGYELSVWTKSQAIYGSGFGTIAIFEDDGNWNFGRTTDILSVDETRGWALVRRSITTLPTTRRLFIKMGLFKTYGTFWVDDVQLTKVDPNSPAPRTERPPCEIR